MSCLESCGTFGSIYFYRKNILFFQLTDNNVSEIHTQLLYKMCLSIF